MRYVPERSEPQRGSGMTTPAPTVTDYDSMVEAFRRRIVELGITYATVDDLANFAKGHTAKLLGPTMPKKFGSLTFNALTATLGVKWVMLQDDEASAKMADHWEKRERSRHRACKQASVGKTTIKRVFPAVIKEFASRGGRARAAKQTPEQRRSIASRAGRARWRRARSKAKLSQAPQPLPIEPRSASL